MPKKSGRGGPRANSGGKRPGAGRPRKHPSVADVATKVANAVLITQQTPIDLPDTSDPIKFLAAVMLSQEIDVKLRVDAAKAMLPFTHKKLGEGGKKEQKQEAAERTVSKFAPAAPPKLKAV